MNVLRFDNASRRVMFAHVLASILLSALVVTSVAAAGLVNIVDGKDDPVVTKQVVRLTKAFPTSTVQEYCTVDVQAYSGYDSATCHGVKEGFVKLNGKTVWSAGWCSSLDNSRGITIVDVDTNSCTANHIQTFDTHDSESNSVALSTYLRQLPPGAVIIGVTGDDPTSKLGPALETLKSLRVDVGDVRERGNFAFVLQKDYSFEPIVAKGLVAEVAPAKISLRLKVKYQILLQQHASGTSFFNKSRTEYKYGFGEESSNYWLGLDTIHSLTVNGNMKLRVEVLSKVDSQWYWAEYDTFRVLDEKTGYVLWVDGYSGTAGNAMQYSNGMRFSTRDRDVDSSCSYYCAATWSYGNNAGFWYSDCGSVFVNSPVDGSNGFTWWYLPIAGTAPNNYKLLISRMYLVSRN